MNRFVRPTRLLGLASLLMLAATVTVSCASNSKEKESQAKQFSSPDAAVESLVNALRNDDRASLNEILAPNADDILSSGDKVADASDKVRFLTLYDVKHRIQTESDGGSTLLLGEGDWPFPVPIVKSGRGYAFDTDKGRDEILNRRIGRNELAAEQVCLALVDAEREYVMRRPMGDALPVYARKILSEPGKKDGLYWPTAEGEAPSPVGPLAAAAAEDARAAGASAEHPYPYRGYCYRLLTSQGPHANGGAMNYEVDGKLIGGFAVVAYPAQYGNSGIMTFMTNHDGIVYQRDLGPDTQKVVQSMQSFDPGPEWTKASEASSMATSQPSQID